MVEYRLDATKDTTVVGVFDPERAPILTIDSGDSVDVETATHFGDAVFPDTTLEDVIRLRNEGGFPNFGPHTLTGPIEVRGAKIGEILKVEIQELVPRTHGFNLFYPGAFGTGLLPEDFPDGELRHFEHDLEAGTTQFAPGVTIPLQPFLGIMGVAPDDGTHTTIPPDRHGGNMDLADLTAGTTLYLPIWVEGANFSTGDAHSKQGNGEVCLSAIETAMRHAKLRFTVLDDRTAQRPFAETPKSWITMGFDEDLLTAAKVALRDMVELLHAQYGLTAGDAYSLCSITGDLSITQVVNRSRGVHVTVPKSIFS